MNNINNKKNKRIGSIDVIRAFALFGIILVHSTNLFCCGKLDTIQSSFDSSINSFIQLFFIHRSAMIFMILFGVSFYLILRKPSYSSGKFVWRCFLLMLIGFLAKLFYWPDALMCYGFFGMLLVFIRKFSIKQIAIVTILLYTTATILTIYKLGEYLTPYIPDGLSIRYDSDSSLKEAVLFLPQGIFWYIKVILNSGVFNILANFSLGYLIGRLGFIERMDQIVKFKHVFWAFIIYVLLFYFHHYFNFEYFVSSLIRIIYIISGAFSYSALIIWLYNHTKLNLILKFFESYGRCGLTNYFMQGFVGVLLLCHCKLAFQHYRFSFIIVGAILFYLLQAFFSYLWLKHFRNGPMEYLWRCATDCKRLPLKI